MEDRPRSLYFPRDHRTGEPKGRPSPDLSPTPLQLFSDDRKLPAHLMILPHLKLNYSRAASSPQDQSNRPHCLRGRVSGPGEISRAPTRQPRFSSPGHGEHSQRPLCRGSWLHRAASKWRLSVRFSGKCCEQIIHRARRRGPFPHRRDDAIPVTQHPPVSVSLSGANARFSAY